jgi:outer membrane PBP1 activator LpoA protein
MRLLPLLMMAFAFSGCATLTAPGNQVYVQAAVDIAVATAETKGVKSTDINRVAKLALAADAGTSATLSTVAAVINAQIGKLNLPPGDLAGVQILEVALSAAIQAKIGDNPTVATTQAAIADVLNAVIAASGG